MFPLAFLLLFSIVINIIDGTMIFIEYNANVIGMIGVKRIEDGSLSISGLFDMVHMTLQNRKHFILSQHFQLYVNGTRIYRNSSNTDILTYVHSTTTEPTIDVLFPEYVKHATPSGNPFRYNCQINGPQRTRFTTFTATGHFEIEFDVQKLNVDNADTDNLFSNLLLFFESDSTKLAVWADVHEHQVVVRLRVWQNKKLYFTSKTWRDLLSMHFVCDECDVGSDVGSDQDSNEDPDQDPDDKVLLGIAALGHFYIGIGDGTDSDTTTGVTVRVRNQMERRDAGTKLFRRGETVRIWFYKAVYANNYEIQNVVMLT